jgi:tetratricopeptide (TPR) repeat protein
MSGDAANGAAPIEPGEARRILGEATDRDEVFVALLRAIRSRASHAALLAVRGGSARGRFALAAGGVDRSVARVELPLDAVPALAKIIASAAPAAVDLATGDAEVDGQIARLLGTMPPSALVLPISLRDRVVALAIGHRGDRPIQLEDAADIIALRPAVSEAILRSILHAKEVEARAIQRAPTETFEDRAGTLEQAGDWEGLALELQHEIAGSSAEDAVGLLVALGEIYRDRLERPDAAAAAYARAAELSPGNVAILEKLSDLYEQLGQPEALIGALLERAEHAGAEARAALLERVADIYRDDLDDRESAYLVLQTALRGNPLSDSIADKLEVLAASTGNWEELVADDAERAVALEDTDPVAACELWIKVGAIYVDKLGNVDQAIAANRRALAIDAASLEALASLAALQERAEAWFALVETLSRRAELEPASDDRVELRVAIGELYESRLDQPGPAIAAYRQAVAEDPTCILALVSLERLLRRAGEAAPLVDVLRRLIEVRDDRAERVRLRLEIAGLLADELDDTAAAIDAYEEVRDLDPQNPAALAGLEQLYERANESERYMDVLEAQLDSEPDAARRVRLYPRLASVWESDFERPERAAAVLEKLAVIEPDHREHYESLARIYGEAGDWDAVAATYQAAIAELGDPAAAAELRLALAGVLERRLDDRQRAIACLRDALSLDAMRVEVLDELARLHEREGEHQRAVDALMLRIDAAPDADTYFEVGRLTARRLDAREQAELFCRRALELDPEHRGSLELLGELLGERGDWTAAAETTARAAALATGADAVRLHTAAGEIFFERLGDGERATAELTAALAGDPTATAAAAPLAEIYWRSERWSELAPLLELSAAGRETAELAYRAGRCAAALGDPDRALERYRRARELDPANPLALAASADLCFELGRLEQAGGLYRELLVHRPDGDQLVRVYLRLASIHRQAGDGDRALDMLARCLSIDPKNTEALEASIELRAERGDFAGVIEGIKTRLATAEGADRAELHHHIGDIYRDKLDNPQKAIAAYVQALELDPDDHQVMQKLLDIYGETGQWKRAVDMIDRFLEVEKDPLRRARYYLAAAAITREELLDRDGAIDLCESALDSFFADPERLDLPAYQRALATFRELDEALTEARDWKRQEQAYRRMIKRLGDRDKPVAARLWHALGEIYRTRLGHYASALEAFNIAQKLDPDNSIRVSILAELSMLADGEKTASIERLTEVIANKPTSGEAYRALFRMYVEAGAVDRAWCVASALAALGQADDDARRHYERHRPRNLPTTRERLTASDWKRIRHPDEDRYVSAIFSAIWEGAALAAARPAKDFGLKKRDLAGSDDVVSAVIPLIADLVERLDVPLPAIYLQPEDDGQLMLANCKERSKLHTALVLRKQIFECTRREAAFLAGKTLALLRPERFLKIALPTNGERRVAMHAALALAAPELPVPAALAEPVATYLPLIREHLSALVTEQLAIVVKSLIAEAPSVDTSRWGNGADATARRVGLLFCGDVRTAARLVSAEQQLVGGPTTAEKVNELVAFSVSESFLATRERLGLTGV